MRQQFAISPTSGSFDSLLSLENDPHSIALVQSDVLYHYRHGNHPQFPKPRARSAVRMLTLLFAECIYIYAHGNNESKPVGPGLHELHEINERKPLGSGFHETQERKLDGAGPHEARILNARVAVVGRSGSGTRVTATNLGRTLQAEWMDGLRVLGTDPTSMPSPPLRIDVRAEPEADGELLFLPMTGARILANAYPEVYRVWQPPFSQGVSEGGALVALDAVLVGNRQLDNAIVERLRRRLCFRGRFKAKEPDGCEDPRSLPTRLSAAWRAIHDAWPTERGDLVSHCTKQQLACSKALGCAISRGQLGQQDPDLRTEVLSVRKADLSCEARASLPADATRPEGPAKEALPAPLIAAHPKLLAEDAGEIETLLQKAYSGAPESEPLQLGQERKTPKLMFWWFFAGVFFLAALLLVFLVTGALAVSRERLRRWEADRARNTLGKQVVRWAIVLLPISASAVWHYTEAVRKLAYLGAQSLEQWLTMGAWYWQVVGLAAALTIAGLPAVAIVCALQLVPGAVPTQYWATARWNTVLRLRFSALAQRQIWIPLTFVVLWVLGAGCLVWGLEFFADTLDPETTLIQDGIFGASREILLNVLGDNAPSLRSEWSQALLSALRLAGVAAFGVVPALVLRVLLRNINRDRRVLVISPSPDEAAAGDRFFRFEVHDALAHWSGDEGSTKTHQTRTLQEGLFQFDFLNVQEIWIWISNEDQAWAKHVRREIWRIERGRNRLIMAPFHLGVTRKLNRLLRRRIPPGRLFKAQEHWVRACHGIESRVARVVQRHRRPMPSVVLGRPPRREPSLSHPNAQALWARFVGYALIAFVMYIELSVAAWIGP